LPFLKLIEYQIKDEPESNEKVQELKVIPLGKDND